MRFVNLLRLRAADAQAGACACGRRRGAVMRRCDGLFCVFKDMSFNEMNAISAATGVSCSGAGIRG